MIQLKRPGPLVQMTMALVTMTISILVLADLVLGISGRGDQHVREMRQQVSESLAVHAAVLLQADDARVLERAMRESLLRVKDLRSIGLRREDGTLLVWAGPHERTWLRMGEATSTTDQVRVALSADDRPWGAMEFAFRADGKAWWAALLASPLMRLLLFVATVGSLAYALYMRRALQHLDPSSVIPERVQRAFDAMAEAVVVLDGRARVMLTNRSFRALGEPEDMPRIGQPLSSLAWLSAALPADPASHPWVRAMSSRQNTFDDPLVLPAGAGTPSPAEAQSRKLVVNCAPILDNAGTVRGCMVTLNDLSELHRVNVALQSTMAELETHREELRRNNEQLHRLATRDALTGCLNRRAFMEGAVPAIAAAQDSAAVVGCLMLDIDHFKSINDTHGHGIGDRVITEVARVLLETAGTQALVGRYGGEEFSIVVPGSNARATKGLGERIRATVESQVGARVNEVQGLRVTISVGAAQLGERGDTLAALLDRADQGLYRAKRGGRNRVMQFTAEQEPAIETVA